MPSTRSLARLAIVAFGLATATSSIAAKVQFDQTPAADALRASLAMVGVPVPIKVCGPAGNVSGPLNFQGPVDLAQGLRRMGADVVFSPMTFEVGCSSAAGAGQSPFAAQVSSVPSGNPLTIGAPDDREPRGNAEQSAIGGSLLSSHAEPSTPSEPPAFEIVRSRYTVGERVTAMMSKFPGLSVLAEPDRVGPVAFSGSRTIVADALKLMAELDRCPTRVEVQASILVKGRTESASRGAGLQLRIGGNDFVLGYANPSGAGISIDIPQLSAFIAAAKANAGFVQLSTIGGQLLEGSEIVLKDGSEVPIRGEAIVTDRETRQSVTYRSVGHNLTLRLQSVGEYLVGEVEHELSTLGATTDLGPTFGTRSTTTAFRVKPFEPLAISLSGLDGGHEERRKGILSAFTAKSRENASAVLILALKPLSCELELAGTETLHGRGGRP